MSLTSYRAAPPRDKLCTPSEKVGDGDEDQRCSRGFRSRPKGFLGRQPRGKARRVRVLCINRSRLWKGPGERFFDFMTAENAPGWAEKPSTCQKFHEGPAYGHKMTGKRHGPAPEPLSAGAGRLISRHGRAVAGRSCPDTGR